MWSDLEIRWQNFRGFADTGWLVLPPLTVLIGPNNAGKSSIIAPMLLLNQTMLSRDASTPLVTRGNLLDAGTFRNILTRHESRVLKFGLRFHIHDASEEKPLRKLGAYPPGALDIAFEPVEDPHGCVLKEYVVYDMFLRKVLGRTLQKSGYYSLSGLPSSDLRVAERKVLKHSRPNHFLFNATLDLSEFIPKERAAEGPAAPDFSEQFSVYLAIVSRVFADMRLLLDQLSYIGPLRDRLRHYYEVSIDRPQTVGPSGERAANLLRYRYAELADSVDKWVQAFELGDRLTLEQLSDDLFSINLLSDGMTTNMADAGFGASQVFPLIVQALTADSYSLTIAEQPEIHLNPRLQNTLADLFVDMALRDRYTLVETHSEHFLLRLRRLIADGKIAPDRVALYFVEKFGDESRVRRIPIEPNGHIPTDEWPRGFFGETLRESLALAAAQAAR